MTKTPDTLPLPYWALLPVNATPLESILRVPPVVSCVLLKDGTLALGVAAGACSTRLDLPPDGAMRVLRALPDGGFVQIIQRGVHSSPPSGAPDAPQTTYWLGVKRWLQHHGKAVVGATRRERCATFLHELASAVSALEGLCGPLHFVSAERFLRLSRGVLLASPVTTMPAQPQQALDSSSPWSDHFLDSELAVGTWTEYARYMSLAPFAFDRVTFVQASTVQSLDHATAAPRSDRPPCASARGLVSVCHEKSDQKQQRERLVQRNKWLQTLLDNPSFRHDEAQSAQEETQSLLAAMQHGGAQMYRSSVTYLAQADGLDALERATQEATVQWAEGGARLAVEQDQQSAVLRSTLPGAGYQSPTGLSLLDRQSAAWWPAPNGDKPRADGNVSRPRSA